MSVATEVMDTPPKSLGAIRDYGDKALLLEFDSTAEVLAWTETLREADLLGVLDIVPASRTVLIKLAATRYQAPARQQLDKLQVSRQALDAATAPPDGRADAVLDVIYDGPDLDEVARLTGMTAEQVIAAHTGTPWRIGFGGFAPGFAYLVDGDARLRVPRRTEPRTQVPAGSVALAGEFSGVYPRQSPSGWQLIGRLSDDNPQLWDVDRDPPALLTPGMWVEFRSVQAKAEE